MTQSKDHDQAEGNTVTAPVGEEAEDHWQSWKAFSLEAYARFQSTIEQFRGQHPGLTDYAIVDRINATQGTMEWWWGAASEVRESINSLNAWAVRLHGWQAWNGVVSSYDDREDKWEVLHHFLEPIAFYCMLQPSSFADRLALTAENLLHQANRRIFPEEPDRLVQDDRPGMHLRRSERQKQLRKLGDHWSQFSKFQPALLALDGADYSQLTHNYRDLAAHSFSPRLMLGQIPRSIRSIGPWTEMVAQEDGSYMPIQHPTKKVVSYALSSQEPLQLADAFTANLAEYRRARNAIEMLTVLIEQICDEIDKKGAISGGAS